MEQKLICAMLSNIQNVNLSHGNFWLKTKDDYIKVIEIEAGHQMLREKYLPLIAQLLVM